MKSLLIGILATTSLAAFAQEGRQLVIENITYPDKVMTLTCLSSDCNIIKSGTRVFDMGSLNLTIENRRGFRKNEVQYSLTRNSVELVKTNVKEGYNGRAVGNTFVTLGALVVDTVIVAPKAVIQLFTPKRDSLKDKRAAKRIKANLMADQGIMKIKHKYFKEISEYIYSISANANHDGDIENLYSKFKSGDVYRCQLTAYISCNDGRYGHYIEASNEAEAQAICADVAQQDDEYFCGLTTPRFDEYVRQISK